MPARKRINAIFRPPSVSKAGAVDEGFGAVGGAIGIIELGIDRDPLALPLTTGEVNSFRMTGFKVLPP